MMDNNELIQALVAAFAAVGSYYGLDRGVRILRRRREEANGDGCISRSDHDRECELKLTPLRDDIAEIKRDVKELLKRNH
jgi:DnaJ-domain-containing protein 1